MFRFTMFRFRRYRVFLISAFFITVALVRFTRNRDWESSVVFGGLHDGKHVGYFDPAKDPSPLKSKTSSPIVDIEHLAHSSQLPTTSKLAAKEDDRPQKSSAVEVVPASKPMATSAPTNGGPKTVPEVVIPNREPAPVAALYNGGDDDTEVYMQSPGRVEPILFTPSPTPIRWVKQQEHFPVPAESIIQLPTGEAKQMPRIQHIFSEETADDRNKREVRQGKVKDEFKRAWNGYKKNAWMHDELSPESGGSRDPFGGWAATLVDSLDTLWIMGLEEEFAEAVSAVADIDFTTCARPDIPLFETTIRYIGGLLGAYDVSGHTHKTLLEKAVELGEVLMGAFDTPNRIPVLFYRWRPAFASQPHRANTRSTLAELGTLAMEFTRLAQLTKEAKYYDAVARITDALEEFQNRGTKLGGIFPEIIDASGCNRSALINSHSLPTSNISMVLNNSLSTEGKGYEVPMPKVAKEPRPSKREASGRTADLEFSVIPGEPSKGQLRVVEDGPGNSKGGAKISKRTESETIPSYSTTEEKQYATERDCFPQGLDSASGSGGLDSFSMGALQDSTYEYFPKVSHHCSRLTIGLLTLIVAIFTP
jgi:mannosyl-oligosaccharide alpha-1,2-mannosidase